MTVTQRLCLIVTIRYLLDKVLDILSSLFVVRHQLQSEVLFSHYFSFMQTLALLASFETKLNQFEEKEEEENDDNEAGNEDDDTGW